MPDESFFVRPGDWRELRASVPLPPGALAAAQALRYGEPVDTYTWDYVAEAALLAVAPLIRADERERIAAASSATKGTLVPDDAPGSLAEKAAGALLAADNEWARRTMRSWSALPEDRARALAGAVMAAVADAVKARADEMAAEAANAPGPEGAVVSARAAGWASAARFILEGGQP